MKMMIVQIWYKREESFNVPLDAWKGKLVQNELVGDRIFPRSIGYHFKRSGKGVTETAFDGDKTVYSRMILVRQLK